MASVLDQAQLRRALELRVTIEQAVGRAYLGRTEVVTLLLTALVARGHILIEGIPGVAKTTLVKAFARSLQCAFRRIQFTPDLLPSDITGTNILDMRTNTFALRAGPVFAQVLLGDEINRAPAKTQAALLEAMAEAQVTIDGETHALPAPFMVLATQNPIDHEGTYPLPEAQVDRFMLKLMLGYPDLEHERLMLQAYGEAPPQLSPIMAPEHILTLQSWADQVYCDPALLDYLLGLSRYTRAAPGVLLGVSPRGTLTLLHAAKAYALLQGRGFVIPDDIRALAPTVFAHRIVTSSGEPSDGLAVVEQALATIPYRAHPDKP